MKCLSVLNPWAALVAIKAKGIETRSWATKYRGPLAIHASSGRAPKHMNIAWYEPFFSALSPLHRDINGKTGIAYRFGCVIATCNLVDCIKTELIVGALYGLNELAFGDYSPGRYAWILEDIQMLPEPIPAKGKLGLWEWIPPEGIAV